MISARASPRGNYCWHYAAWFVGERSMSDGGSGDGTHCQHERLSYHTAATTRSNSCAWEVIRKDWFCLRLSPQRASERASSLTAPYETGRAELATLPVQRVSNQYPTVYVRDGRCTVEPVAFSCNHPSLSWRCVCLAASRPTGTCWICTVRYRLHYRPASCRPPLTWHLRPPCCCCCCCCLLLFNTVIRTLTTAAICCPQRCKSSE